MHNDHHTRAYKTCVRWSTLPSMFVVSSYQAVCAPLMPTKFSVGAISTQTPRFLYGEMANPTKTLLYDLPSAYTMRKSPVHRFPHPSACHVISPSGGI